jgi:hypothetical protein
MRPEEIENGAMTRTGRLIRLNVIGRISLPAWRRMIHETYPAQDSGWWDRFGHEVGALSEGVHSMIQPMAGMAEHAHHLVERARRAGLVVVAPADQDALYGAQVDEAARRRAHLGRTCSGWADEEDYGPRYS